MLPRSMLPSPSWSAEDKTLLQEGEAASRQAKCRWSRARGIGVYQLQHDGVVVARQTDAAGVAQAMSEAASAACGLPVVVIPED